MINATRPLPPELARVHMVGIGGAGMSGIARILLDRGAMVSGSDAKESRGVAALRARGALISIGHDPANLDLLTGGPTAVITTHAAIPKTNPELVEARRRAVPVILRPAALAPLRALGLALSAFEAEAGRVDGGLEHAVERAFNFVVRAAGFHVSEAGVDL